MAASCVPIKRRRVGRGIGSSKGKTCGKGHKGQRARNRSSIPRGFEGGQTKFWKLLPKKGFSNKRHRQKQGSDMAKLNLGTIQDYIDMGRLKIASDNEEGNTNTSSLPTLGVVDFIEAGILKRKTSLPGVKLLAKGKERFKSPVKLVVNRASEEAIARAEKVGGRVMTMHYNRLAMRAFIRPDKFLKLEQHGDSDNGDDEEEEGEQHLLPKQARPPPKMQPYYTSWRNRGYLCPQMQMREWLQSRPEMMESFEKALMARTKKEGKDGKEATEKQQKQL